MKSTAYSTISLASSKLLCTILPIALGLLSLTLTPQNGFAQVPQISQPLVPAAVEPGSAGLVITVNGTGFTPSSVVDWNGAPRTTTFVSNTKVLAAITAADVSSPTTAWVAAVNSNARKSNLAYFEVTNPAPSVSFVKTDFPTGNTPYFVTAADLNGDGKLDLVIPNFHDNTISVLLGNGDGSFQTAVNYATGSLPGSIAVGDFNADGKLDLAVTNTGDSTVGVFFGNGDGTFQSAVNYGVGSWPVSVAAGDFSGDGKLDLAVANFYGNTVMVLLGNGDGSFQPPATYSAGTNPARVAVGDFNGDGKLDLVVANTSSSNVSVLFGNGDGTFQSALNSPADYGLSSLTVADLNGDGKLDLVVAANYNPSVGVLLGNGDGTFQAEVDYGAGTGAWWTAVGDFNGDGKPDLAVADWVGNSVSVLLGNGNGTFQPTVNYAVDTSPAGIVAGDFNSDGRMDIAVPNAASNSVSILLQSNPVNYSAQIQPPIASDGSSVFKANRGVVPVKFTLELNGVSTCNLPAATISLIEISGTSPGPVNQDEYEVASDNGTSFRVSDCQYVYNLGASNLGPGRYKVQITISGLVAGSGIFGLQ